MGRQEKRKVVGWRVKVMGLAVSREIGAAAGGVVSGGYPGLVPGYSVHEQTCAVLHQMQACK